MVVVVKKDGEVLYEGDDLFLAMRVVEEQADRITENYTMKYIDGSEKVWPRDKGPRIKSIKIEPTKKEDD